MEITLNKERRLFVIPAGVGYTSTMGFDVVYKHLRALSERIARFGIAVGTVSRQEIGSFAQWEFAE